MNGLTNSQGVGEVEERVVVLPLLCIHSCNLLTRHRSRQGSFVDTRKVVLFAQRLKDEGSTIVARVRLFHEAQGVLLRETCHCVFDGKCLLVVRQRTAVFLPDIEHHSNVVEAMR